MLDNLWKIKFQLSKNYEEIFQNLFINFVINFRNDKIYINKFYIFY